MNSSNPCRIEPDKLTCQTRSLSSKVLWSIPKTIFIITITINTCSQSKVSAKQGISHDDPGAWTTSIEVSPEEKVNIHPFQEKRVKNTFRFFTGQTESSLKLEMLGEKRRSRGFFCK